MSKKPSIGKRIDKLVDEVIMLRTELLGITERQEDLGKRLRSATIEWHPWPDEKPDGSGTYLLSLRVCGARCTAVCIAGYGEDHEQPWFCLDMPHPFEVSFWAIAPLPYYGGE